MKLCFAGGEGCSGILDPTAAGLGTIFCMPELPTPHPPHIPCTAAFYLCVQFLESSEWWGWAYVLIDTHSISNKGAKGGSTAAGKVHGAAQLSVSRGGGGGGTSALINPKSGVYQTDLDSHPLTEE